jgi:hypothetical protein
VANYPIAAGTIAAHDKTLTASTVDTVTFATQVEQLKVWTDGTAAVYFTVDGTTPTVSGAHCFKIPATVLSETVNVQALAPRVELALAELAGAVFSAGLTGSIRRADLSHIEDLLAERISVEHSAQLVRGVHRRDDVGLPLGPERSAA